MFRLFCLPRFHLACGSLVIIQMCSIINDTIINPWLKSQKFSLQCETIPTTFDLRRQKKYVTIFLGQEKHYTYRVFWSEDDQEFVAVCAEFPGLSSLETDQTKALTDIVDLVKFVIEDMNANGEPLPEPLMSRKYTGKFMVRVPPETHRKLTLEAAEAHISLNRLVSEKLARSFRSFG